MQFFSKALSILISISLTACHSTTGTNAVTSSSVAPPPQQLEVIPGHDYLRDAFSKRKVILKQSPGAKGFQPAAAEAVDSEIIPQGAKLTALVDNACVAAMESSMEAPVSVPAAAEGVAVAELELQAYDFTVAEDQSLNDLKTAAENDPCLIGVTNSGEASINAVPNDPFYASSNQNFRLQAADAWDWFYESDKRVNMDINIAIVDTGIRFTHQDLAANMWTSPTGTFGYDFINNDNNPTDDNGHGTHVAGITGAVNNNGLGASGVMGRRVKLMGVKVLSAAGNGSFAAIANGINYAVAQGAHIINMSLGAFVAGGAADTEMDPIVAAAITNAVAAGVTVIIAAGNNNANLDSSTSFPANMGARIAGVLSIGSIDSVSNVRSSFSNFSATRVELFAPGAESTNVSGIFAPYFSADNAYARLQGTSMATPIVAGAAGLALGMLRTNNVAVTPAQLEALLVDSAPVNANLNGLGRQAKSLNLLSLAVGLASTYAAADPRKLSITTQPVPVTAVEGTASALSVVVSSFPAARYQWVKAGVNVPGATAATLNFASLQPADFATFQVNVTNGFTNLSSAAVLMNVLFRPRIVTQPATIAANMGQAQTLALQSIANPMPTYQWLFNGVPLLGKTEATLNFTSLKWTDRGAYVLRITNAQGTIDSTPIQLNLNAIERPNDGGLTDGLEDDPVSDGGLGGGT